MENFHFSNRLFILCAFSIHLYIFFNYFNKKLINCLDFKFARKDPFTEQTLKKRSQNSQPQQKKRNALEDKAHLRYFCRILC